MGVRKVNVIVDLQFGSTGKGLLAGYLAEKNGPDTVVTAWSANAGHTYIDSGGREYIHTMLANGIVSPKLKQVLLGPGSVIDPDKLLQEIEQCEDILQLRGASILVHANAAFITQAHRDEESGPMTKIGSTKKGCGAAAIQRIRRNPDKMNVMSALRNHPVLERVKVVEPADYNRALDQGKVIQVEGAQGYSLSMYHGFYPYCTSRDVSTAQILADCAIPFGWKVHVIGTARTYPIRVANRYDDKGKQIGWSGPCYYDQTETSFEHIGQKTELTTVTKLPRRVFTFSSEQISQAVRQCGATAVFLNFANYCRDLEELKFIVSKAEAAGARLRYVGFGPSYKDVYDINYLMEGTRGADIYDVLGVVADDRETVKPRGREMEKC